MSSSSRERYRSRRLRLLSNPSALLLHNREPGMSKERRKFVIVNIFDFVLCTLLWLLSAVTKPYKNSWLEAFVEEVDIFRPYFLYNSLFDLAIAAFLRMSVLLVAYALIKCDHWFPVALTTAGTTIFVATKIFFFFDKDKSQMQQNLLIIASLCVAWFELWLMPFRVLHREQQREIEIEANGANADEAGRIAAQSLIRQIVINEEELFQTAMEADSSDENDDRCKNVSRIGKISRRKCKEAIARAQNIADHLIGNVHSWKVLQKCASDGGGLDVRFHDESNSYYVKAHFEHSAQAVWNATWKENHKWNTQILESRLIAVIDSTTDIIISAGIVFVGVYVSVETADDAIRQQQQERDRRRGGGGPEVRGRNGVNMIRISQFGPDKSLFEWIMNTDLRLSIPRMLIRRTLTTFFAEYCRLMANFLRENPTGIK
uniref:MENTAL domain-containing protein n=1 Tax=Globodera rostochiensis TaxID=31243 RepID=A0A914GVR2_GLORO